MITYPKVEMNLAYPMSNPSTSKSNMHQNQLRQDSKCTSRCCISAFATFPRLLPIQPVRNRQRNRIHPLRLLLISTLCLRLCSALCGATSITDIMPSKVPRLSPDAIVPTQPPPRAGESSLPSQLCVFPPPAPRCQSEFLLMRAITAPQARCPMKGLSATQFYSLLPLPRCCQKQHES
ncbi:hypothetical protein J3F84DRAFT_389321 [Trichoderma pleuroticola]